MKTSESIQKIAEALCNVQAAIEPAVFNSVNPHFKSKYANLNSVYNACRHLLVDNGLSIVQFPATSPVEHGPSVALTTRLMHESGEWMEDTMVVPLGKATAQQYGSALTYARRYALSAIIGIVSDEDDDASGAERTQPSNNQTGKNPVQAKPSEAQMRQFHKLGAEAYGPDWNEKRPELVDWVTSGRSKSSKHLTAVEWQKLMDGMKAKVEA